MGKQGFLGGGGINRERCSGETLPILIPTLFFPHFAPFAKPFVLMNPWFLADKRPIEVQRTLTIGKEEIYGNICLIQR